MEYIIYGVIASLLTSVFFRIGAQIRNRVPENFRFLIGIAGVVGLQILVLGVVIVMHLTQALIGNTFLNLALSIPVAMGFGLGIFKGMHNKK